MNRTRSELPCVPPFPDAPRAGDSIPGGAENVAKNLDYLADYIATPALTLRELTAARSQLARQAERLRKATT